MLFAGSDTRYTFGVFDVLSFSLSQRLHSLPTHLRPDNKERRMKVLGYSFEHWLAVRLWFAAPFAHHEDIREGQEVSVSMMDELRREVAAYTSTTDPYQQEHDEIVSGGGDVTAFSRQALKTPGAVDDPEGTQKVDPSLKLDEYVYWACNIFDVHMPIIRTYGRYPYRNSSLGRLDTEAEEGFLRNTKRFGCLDEESAKLIRQDVEKGVWRPLVAERDSKANTVFRGMSSDSKPSSS